MIDGEIGLRRVADPYLFGGGRSEPRPHFFQQARDAHTAFLLLLLMLVIVIQGATASSRPSLSSYRPVTAEKCVLECGLKRPCARLADTKARTQLRLRCAINFDVDLARISPVASRTAPEAERRRVAIAAEMSEHDALDFAREQLLRSRWPRPCSRDVRAAIGSAVSPATADADRSAKFFRRGSSRSRSCALRAAVRPSFWSRNRDR